MSTSSQSLVAGDEIDLRAVASRLWAGRWWVVLIVSVFTMVFLLVAFLSTPIYRSTTKLVPASSERSGMGLLNSALGQLGGLASLAGVGVGGGDSQTQEALAVLMSREFSESFIREHGLMQEFFAKDWDAKSQNWLGEPEKWPTYAQAFRYFDSRVRTMNRDRLTGLVTIDIEWKDPEKAAAWANALVMRLNAEMRSRAMANANASIGYLEKELAATTAIETRQSISRLIEAQINQRMLANVTQEYAFRVVDRALPSDPDDEVKPNKPLLALLGPVMGGVLGALLVLIFGGMASHRRSP